MKRVLQYALRAALVPALAAAAQAQHGLLGQYFNSSTPPAPGTPPAFQRVDATINFTWGGNAPTGTPIIADDDYSERWTGYVNLAAAGTWTFTTTSNDGVRLWIDDILVIDQWTVHPTQTHSGPFTALDAGWVPVRLEHFNQGGTAVMRLYFHGPGQEPVVIPNNALCSNGACIDGNTPTFSVEAGPDRYMVPPATEIAITAQVRGVKLYHPDLVANSIWTQLSGPTVELIDSGPLQVTVVPSRPGVIRLRVRVFHPLDGIATDDVTLYAFGETGEAVVAGSAHKWDKLSFTFQHDSVLSESSATNPFLDVRLFTYFYHPESGRVKVVPGFFAADGNAAETSATSGTRWRTNFSPDRAGRWHYLASFRSGTGLALSTDPEAGTPFSFDGASGTFEVAPADPFAGGFLSKGRLEYVESNYLRLAETHEYFLKGGADSPENLLAYYQFDNTVDFGGNPNDLANAGYLDGLHHYDAHFGDYVDRGVPLWQGAEGRSLFGAIDYLAMSGVNSVYALTYNVDGGDGREVYPWVTPGDKLRFDVSKLAQWERLADHMTRAGVAWHLILQETENDQQLDGGDLGVQRKLYHRELVARFGHVPALIWNLGEENSNTPAQREAFADHLRAIDPYDHPIALHNVPGDLDGTYGSLLGSHLEIVSLQGEPSDVSDDTQFLVTESAEAGRPWVVNCDEQNPAEDGAVPDAQDFWHTSLRQLALWPNLMSGGGGCEWYFGYAYPDSDLDCEDFRSRDNLWRITRRALDFLRQNVPFDEMDHDDSLATGVNASVLAKTGEFYLVYLPFGGSTSLTLGGPAQTYRVSWFDARNGGALQSGTVTMVNGPGTRSIGSPPGTGDWVAFVRRLGNHPPVIQSIDFESDAYAPGSPFAMRVFAHDQNGPEDALTVTVAAHGPDGFDETFSAPHRGGDLYSVYVQGLPKLASGEWVFDVTVEDEHGSTATQSVTVSKL